MQPVRANASAFHWQLAPGAPFAFQPDNTNWRFTTRDRVYVIRFFMARILEALGTPTLRDARACNCCSIAATETRARAGNPILRQAQVGGEVLPRGCAPRP